MFKLAKDITAPRRIGGFGPCDYCGADSNLICGDGMSNYFCSAQCCSDAQAPADHNQERMNQLQDDEELLAHGWYQHQYDCEEGL